MANVTEAEANTILSKADATRDIQYTLAFRSMVETLKMIPIMQSFDLYSSYQPEHAAVLHSDSPRQALAHTATFRNHQRHGLQHFLSNLLLGVKYNKKQAIQSSPVSPLCPLRCGVIVQTSLSNLFTIFFSLRCFVCLFAESVYPCRTIPNRWTFSQDFGVPNAVRGSCDSQLVPCAEWKKRSEKKNLLHFGASV